MTSGVMTLLRNLKIKHMNDTVLLADNSASLFFYDALMSFAIFGIWIFLVVLTLKIFKDKKDFSDLIDNQKQ